MLIEKLKYELMAQLQDRLNSKIKLKISISASRLYGLSIYMQIQAIDQIKKIKSLITI